MTEIADYHALYLEGIRYFNDCEFFEAHDSWEELWTEYRGDSREFYKGLIQVAVALHHFGNENIRGARKVYGSGSAYLAKFRPVHMGIDLEKLLVELKACFQEVIDSDEEFPQITIDGDLIPEIHLDPPAPDGDAQ